MSRKVVVTTLENQAAPDASSQTTALECVLDWITSSSPINRDRGTNFERLCIAFLKNCPRWTAVFSDVLPFGEWAKKHEKTIANARDTGIDLVGIRHDGTFTAIQCKFFTSKATVSKPEIDSFIAASALTNTVGHNGFHDRLLISTAPLNANALKTIHENRVLIVTRDELKESGFNWACYLPKEGRFEKDAREHQDLRAYQEEAVTAVTNAFLKKNAEKLERAQIHMACGTGKTLTSLRIAEKVAGEGKLVLFLAPSLGLVQQTLDAWTNFSDVLIRPYVVCSDGDMGKRIEDIEGTRFEIQTLAYPATTDPASLLKAFHKGNRGGNRLNGQKTHMPMTVIFATYQSLNVIHHAQQMQNGLKEFDLIICDEAHRTTGQIEDSDDPGMFQRVTEADYLWGAHRLFMTATPRVYSPTAVTRARQDGMKLASMDDAALYGPVVFEYSFRQAVDDEWLADYRLVVLRVQEKDVREMLAQSPDKAISSSHEDGDENPVIQLDDMKLDDAARIVGCWRAMIGHDLAEDEGKPEGAEKTIPQQMKRAVAFCSSIEAHNSRVSSKVIANAFTHVTNLYNEQNSLRNLHAKARHVDGSMSSNERKDALDWLRENTEEGTSRILTNVRCLSEGIDVPSLDAALFMSPRNSTVDIIQSVGRVMRKAPGKKLGYIIVPIVIPDEITDDNIENWLDNSNSGFATLYKLAAALRSHDPQLEADANQVAIGARHNITNLLTITTLPRKHKKLAEHVADGGTNLLKEKGEKTGSIQGELALHSIDTFGGAVRARLVKRLGSGVYWDEWAHKAGTIATRLVTEITHIRKTTTSSDPVAIETCVKAQKAFSTLLATMRKMLNASITEDQLTGMLAQHIVTLPLFEALFGDSEATRTEKNPVARELEPCITAFRNTGLTRFEGVELRNFWQEVQRSVRGMNAVGRQKVIKTLYEKFIRNAFPKEAKSFGVVYTPPEIVDFILHSIQHVMKENFGHGMEAENVHVLDPFTGTGTFIARLLASDILTPDQVREKYNSAIWANEIMLLTYYIATINIETEYAAITGEWTPFRGAVLADTFTLDDSDLDRLAGLHGNADRIRSEVADRNIRVIFGNPPYSAGATKAADGTENISYPSLDKRIETTYAAASTSANKNSLYDSYIRAIRWASDRLGNQGVIGFVSNAGFLESAAAAGIRKCLAEEFSDIQVFHLRGGIRGKSGDMARQEGGSVFNIMTAVAITILVKNPPKASRGTIHFHDIGNCLSRNEKLAKIASFKSVKGISQANAWHNITPDEHSDWLGQRDESFGAFISIGDKKNPRTPVLFDVYSNGLQTNRDAWVWNFSRTEAEQSVKRMVEVYERERARLHPAFSGLDKTALASELKRSPDFETPHLSWTSSIQNDVIRNRKLTVSDGEIRIGSYRPFTREWIFFSERLNHRTGLQSKIFPYEGAENVVICVTGNSSRTGFNMFIMNNIVDLNIFDAGTQCFPLYRYSKNEEIAGENTLFSNTTPTERKSHKGYTRHDAITDIGLAHFQEACPNLTISKEDLFYYIYGILHSPEYRQKYASSLSKELPRIPRVKKAACFTAFMEAGRKLGTLHADYDKSAPYAGIKEDIRPARSNKATFRVEKMKYGSNKSKNGKDKTTLIYNEHVTITNIPLEAYEYVINSKPALDWVMERQCITTDKRSGITNDANAWANEVEHNPRYPLDLFLKIITVSLETVKIVKNLPPLEVLED